MDIQESIRVAIVEDEQEIRELLEQIIDLSPGFSCKRTFSSCEDALPGLIADPPDVVLMDINLPGMDGISGTGKLTEQLPELNIIMLTIQDDPDLIYQSLCAGATGYLLKDTPPVKLLQAIEEVRQGGSPMSPSIARKVTMSFRPAVNYDLSDREKEILTRLTQGENYQVIAAELFISGHTVRTHIRNIYRKLQVNTRGEAVSTALRNKIV